MNDPYSILGVARNASEAVIKSAYKQLVRKYHPDRYPDPDMAKLANEKMSEINTAYDRIMEDRRNGVSYDSYSSQTSYSTGRNYSSSGNTYNKYSDFNPETAFDAYSVRQLLASGDLNAADSILAGVPENQRDAEWYYLKGMISYRRGWFNEAYHYTSQATRLAPGNQEYSEAFRQMNRQRSGYMTGSAYQPNSPMVNSPDVCDILNGLCLADCCCECLGGDLIPCC